MIAQHYRNHPPSRRLSGKVAELPTGMMILSHLPLAGRSAYNVLWNPLKERAVALVFVLDDDKVTGEGIAAALAREGHELKTFDAPETALDAAREDAPAVAITDFAMPGMNGLEFTLALRKISPDTTFLVVSGQATVEDAVSLMKHGVVDVMTKPPRARALRKALGLALVQYELAAENRRLRQALRGRRNIKGVIGTSPAFEAVLRQVEKVASSPSSVLLGGETGTGKEIIAEAIHELSPRAEQRLVKVHCAAIPESLLESELFGHMRGSFTGALRDRAGLFEQAHGGTLFLDEIGEIAPAVQVKLLRALQSYEIQRVGDTRTRKIDVRVITATNRDLDVEVAEGRFRQDLFYRLNVIAIRIPSLRQRGGDIELLARHFLAREKEKVGRNDLEDFDRDTLARLSAWHWPGNVRELENCVARVVALAEGPKIRTEDLPATMSGEGQGDRSQLTITQGMTLAEAERLLILHTLEEVEQNKREASERLGISLATLYRKLSQYQVSTPGNEDDTQ